MTGADPKGNMRIHVTECEEKMERACKQAKNDERKGDFESADWAKMGAREWRKRRDYARDHGGWWEHEYEPLATP